MTPNPSVRNHSVVRTLLALLFVAAGCMHFVATATLVKIIPPYFPHPHALVYISGLAEIAGGVGLLLERTRRLAAWGLVALLIAVFPANVYMLHAHILVFGSPLPSWLLWARLPLQIPLIWWAYSYTRDGGHRR